MNQNNLTQIPLEQVNVSVDKDNFPQLISQVTESGERVIIEQQGKAIAAIIPYNDLKLHEAIEAILLKKAEQQEYEWLKAAIRNPAFDSLRDPEEDIYTLADGKRFHDPEWAKSVLNDPDLISLINPEEDIYTLADGKPFHDEG